MSALLEKIYLSQISSNAVINGPFGERYLTYADYIASGQPLDFIEDFIKETVLPTYANTHTEASFTGKQTSKFREEAREIIKKSVNASEEDVLIFTGTGCTGAIDLLVRKLIQRFEKESKNPVVFIGPYEHHSNILPWREGPFDLVEIPINSDGNIDLPYLEAKLIEYQGRHLIGSFSAASNVTGILAPVEEITALLKKYNALSFWDYAGAAPYVSIDMNPADGTKKDAIFISPHKLMGGPGSPGILIAKNTLFDFGLPVCVGGGTVHFVTKSKQRYIEDIETREEGGTPGIIEAIRAGLAFELKESIGHEIIEGIESKYIERVFEKFSNNENVFILGNTKVPRLAFMAFHIKFQNRFLHHNFVVALLNDLFGIQSRGGCSCAGPYGHDLLDLSEEKSSMYMVELATGNVGIKPGWVRLNFNYFIPNDELEFIIDAIEWISYNGWKLLKTYTFNDENGIWSSSHKHEIKLRSLKELLNNPKPSVKGTPEDKVLARLSYFAQADEIAEKAHNEWLTKPNQEYMYSQKENTLRWYSLSDDVSLD